MSVTFKDTATILNIDERTASGRSVRPPTITRLSRGRRLEMSDVSVDGAPSANKRRLQVMISGMSCSSCVAKIERHLGKKKGQPMHLCVMFIC